MSNFKLIGKIGMIILIFLGGLLLVSNPGEDDYEKYATNSLADYIKSDLCNKSQGKAGRFLASQCKSLVDISRPQLGEFIGSTTERKNFFLFSIYETQLPLFEPFPSYRFHTVGLLQQFYVFHYEEL
jgi:hypothetical protein